MNVKHIAKEILAGAVPHIEQFLDEWEINDYPYGTYRTTAKWWVEKKSGKQRILRTTIDPKTGRVNKPKATTYASSAKVGIGSDNRVYPITGGPGQITVWASDMQHSVAAIFTRDTEYKHIADGLGIKEIQQGVQIKEIDGGIVIDGLQGKQMPLRELMTTAGLSPERISDIKNMRRQTKITHEEWTVTFKSTQEVFKIFIKSKGVKL